MEKAKAVAMELERRGKSVDVMDLYKDGRNQKAIVVNVNEVVRPTFYLDDLKGTVNEMADMIDEALIDIYIPNLSVEDITNYESVRDKLMIGFLPYGDTGAGNLLKRSHLGMTEYIYVKYSESTFMKATIQLLEKWGVDIKDVLTDARNNMIDAAYTKSLAKRMSEISGEEIPDDDQIRICSVRGDKFGAGVLSVTEVFESVANDWNDDLYIIPSSIHEVLCVRATGGDIQDLRDMVKSVNDTDVAENEILSYEVFKYEKFTGLVKIA